MYRNRSGPGHFYAGCCATDRCLDAYAEVLEVLQVTPWNGRPQHEDNPEGAVRHWKFGVGQAGQVVYLILEEQQEVHLLLVQWWG